MATKEEAKMKNQRIVALLGIALCALAIGGVVWANGGIAPTTTSASAPSATELEATFCARQGRQGMVWDEQKHGCVSHETAAPQAIHPVAGPNADLGAGVLTEYGLVTVKKVDAGSFPDSCASYMDGTQESGYGILGMRGDTQPVLQPIVQNGTLYLRAARIQWNSDGTMNFSADNLVGQFELGDLPASIYVSVDFPDGTGAGQLTTIVSCPN